MPLARKLARFSRRVFGRFYRRNGFLFASAVAYNTLLSVVPLLGLALVLASVVVEPETLRRLIDAEIEQVLPGSGEPIQRAFASFVEQRAVASGVSVVVLIIFSALAFRSLDEAISAMFVAPEHHPQEQHRFAEVIIPLAYVGLVSIGILFLTLISVGLEMLPDEGFTWFGRHLSLATATHYTLRLFTFAAMVAILSSFYRVMPEVHVRMRHAVPGGFVAALFWEVFRQVLVWYFENVSLVGVIYGSLTTVVVLLLSFEAFALIVLIGAQVIAEVDRSHRAHLEWWEEPAESMRMPPTVTVSQPPKEPPDGPIGD
ncbi:MAG: YihY/virulence factor BrkB family protein [Myxococcales bacterium]|nr:YihY/virulence factor BrkB family protein [Myxococcales bacterium]